VHANSRARFEEGYQKIAERTRLPSWDQPDIDILKLVNSWLCEEANGRWVMIIDNADDIDVFPRSSHKGHGSKEDISSNSATSLLEFLPQSPNGSILITSRSRDVAFRLTGSYSDIIKVQPMDQEQALALLRNKFDESFEQDDAAALVEALDYMPLAITQAAAYISKRSPRATVSSYLQNLRKGDRERDKLLETDTEDSRRDGTASNSILATWQISFEYILKDRPSATRLLSIMSLFDRQGIPEHLLLGSYQEEDNSSSDFEDDLNTLTGFSLVAINIDGSQFEMHRLVQFSTRKWLELRDELEGWKEKYVRLMDDSYPQGWYENWKVCQALFPHAQATVTCRPTDNGALEAWASVLYKAAWYAEVMGNYNEAEDMGRGALGAREAALGAEHPATLTSVNNLGAVLQGQGKYKEAEAMHQRALEAKEKVLGREHLATISSVNNLGVVLESQGKYKEAKAMHQRALEAREKMLGREHIATLISVNNLGTVLQSQGKYEEAKALHQRALDVREKVLGREHPATLTSVGNLAAVLKSQGKYEEAKAMHQRALEAREKVLGREHPDTLTSVYNLGAVLESQGKYEEAEAMHQRALEVKEKVLGREHPDTLTSVYSLGIVLESQGRYEEAQSMYQRSLEGSKKVLGQEHPDTLTRVSNLGLVLKRQGKYEEAEAMFQRVLEVREQVLGQEHPDTLTNFNNLAVVLLGQGKCEEAEAMHQRALEAQEKVLGREHPDTLVSMANLAYTWKLQSRNGEAVLLMEKCFELQKRILGAHHPNTEIMLEALDQWRMENAQ
jgi:tetratricopeptide (TPR) repeat protein